MPRHDTGPPHEIPSAAWMTETRRRLVLVGYTAAEAALIVAPGQSRRQIREDIIARQRVAPKGE